MFALAVNVNQARIFCLKSGLLVLLALFMGGCKVGPDFHRPVMQRTAQYTPAVQPTQTVSAEVPAGHSQYLILSQELPAQWWTVFQSPALNDLIVKGLNHSPNVKAAQAALRQAQENLTAGIGTTFFPAVNAQVNAQRQQTNDDSFGEGSSSPMIFNLLNPAFNLSYTLDLFGGGRRTVEALCAAVDYQRYQLEGTYLALTANIVTLAINEASFRAQVKATHELIASAESSLKLVNQQFNLGAVSYADVFNQETQLAQTRATLPPLEKSLAQTRHALAVLVGDLPSESCLPIFTLEALQLPAGLPLTMPSMLVRKRPDIRAVEALLHQASAQIGVATANLFPKLSLSANFGWESEHLGSLFKSYNQTWSYGGQLLQPLFNGGALLANRRSAIAAYDQVLAQYQQTVLQAFQNVADVLRAIEMDAKTLKYQAIAEKSAKNSLDLTEKQFQLGAISYLNLLQAQQTYQETLIARIQAQAARYLDTAALFQALGGSWVDDKQYKARDLHG